MNLKEFYNALKDSPSLSDKLGLQSLSKQNGPAWRWFYDNYETEPEPPMYDIRLWHLYGALSTMGVCTIDDAEIIFTSPIQNYVDGPDRFDSCLITMGATGFTARMDNGDIFGRPLSSWAEIVDVFVARYGVRL